VKQKKKCKQGYRYSTEWCRGKFTIPGGLAHPLRRARGVKIFFKDFWDFWEFLGILRIFEEAHGKNHLLYIDITGSYRKNVIRGLQGHQPFAGDLF
jgi:hypothetical protein